VKRRRFLRGVGGVALATPFLGSLRRPARAAGAAADPRRLVIFYTNNGCLTNRWFPSVEDGPIDGAALTGTTLAGLSTFAPKLLFPRGFGMFPRGNVTIDGVEYFDPHDQGMGSKLTCAPIDPVEESGHWALGRSLDHVAAELVNQPGTPPLVLSVGNFFSDVKGVISYSGPREPYAPITNPSTVYQSLTDVFVGGDATGEADFRIAQGESVIDLVEGELQMFQSLNMSGADQQRVTEWLDLLRQTEIEVSAACNAETAAMLGLSADELGGMGGRPSFVDTGTAFIEHGELMMKLIALTMMCDTNRVIILQWPGYVTFDFDGMGHTADHHGLSHRNGTVGVGGTCAAEVLTQINEIDSWYAARYVRLVEILDGIDEGEGTLLDNSAVMWLPELADGNSHNNNNLPIVIAGGAGGYLRTGAAVNLEGRELGTGNSEADCADGDTSVGFGTGSPANIGNVPLNRLYVTLLNAIGARDENGDKIAEFGMVDSNDIEAGITQPGELSELLA